MKRSSSSRRNFLATGLASAVTALVLKPNTVSAQGALTPLGAPAPTMKTLDQIEPRIAVQSLTGDATAQFIISQSGSY